MDMFTQMFADWPKHDLGLGALYAVLGFVFVFLGITLLIAIIRLVGLVMEKLETRKKKGAERAVSEQKAAKSDPHVAIPEEGIPPEVVAAITAALTAYYEKEAEPCEFIVRRIGRR